MKLIASAIVRNEAGRYLEPWLRHLLTFCDEVRLLDDGSTDHTREIAAEHPEVHVQENRGVPFMEFESEARNALLDWTLRGEPDYVLSIDADEFIGDTHGVREFIHGGASVFNLTMREVWKVHYERITNGAGVPVARVPTEVGLRVDGLWGDRRCPLLWRAPGQMRRGSRWQIPRRKLACGREPIAVRGQRGLNTDIGIYHFGWTREGDRQSRAQRYIENDGGRFHASTHIQSILWPDSEVTLDWQPWPFSIPPEIAVDA